MYNECGGCYQIKTDYDWDAQVHPEVKALAESMGCGGAPQAGPVVAMLAAAIGHFLR